MLSDELETDNKPGNTEVISETTKITNLNTDCMEAIFKHLELNELLSVADSSARFHSAACQVYKRKFWNIIPIFSPNLKSWIGFLDLYKGVEMVPMAKHLLRKIENPKTFLKLLRNFGHLIKNLEICYWKTNPNIYVGIETYLSQYCFDSVQRLSLFCVPTMKTKTPLENLQRPLKRVVSLIIITSAVESPKYIRFINENNLPNVRNILVDNRKNELHDSDKIHFKILRNVEHCTLFTMRIDTYPFEFENLKHFTVDGNINVNDAFCECISKIEHLKTLKIMSFALFSIESFSKMLELKNVVSNVEEMQFKFHDKISPEIVLQFLKQSQRVQKLSIHLNEVSSSRALSNYSYLFQTIPSNLHDDEWKSHIEDPYKNRFSTLFRHKCLVVEKISP